MTFSIRDIMLITAVVAIAAAWWLDHRSLILTVTTLQTQVLEQKSRMVYAERSLDFLKGRNEQTVKYLQSQGIKARAGKGGRILFADDGEIEVLPNPFAAGEAPLTHGK